MEIELPKGTNEKIIKNFKAYKKILKLFTTILSMKTFITRGNVKEEAIESKLIKTLRDALFPSLDSYEFIIELISLDKATKTQFDISILVHLLCEKYSFFQTLKDQSEHEVLRDLISVLSLEYFKAGENIIVYEDSGNKYYIILQGSMGVFRPQFFSREMSLKNFCLYLRDLKYNKQDNNALERIEIKNESDADLAYDVEIIKQSDYNYNNIGYGNDDIDCIKSYFVEESEHKVELKPGKQFGEMALLNNEKRNATITCSIDSIVASICKDDYDHIIKEIETKRLKQKREKLKKDYFIFKTWSEKNLNKILSLSSPVNLVKGEYLYEQNDQSDCMYFSTKGFFECYTTITNDSYKKMKKMIEDNRGNIYKWIASYRFKKVSHQMVTEMIKENRVIYEKTNYNHDNKNNDNLNLPCIDKERSVMGNNKRQAIRPKNYKVQIRKINYKECFGIEELFDCKRRYTSIKCLSPTAELFKINIIEFIQILCEKSIELREIKMLVDERKKMILVQLNNYISFDNLIKVQKKKEASDEMSKAHNDSQDKSIQLLPIRVNETKLCRNASDIIIKSQTELVTHHNKNLQLRSNMQLKNALLQSMNNSLNNDKSDPLNLNRLNGYKSKKQKQQEALAEELEKEKERMRQYNEQLHQKDFPSLRKEIFYVAGFHKLSTNEMNLNIIYPSMNVSPQEQTMTILNSFAFSNRKSRNKSKEGEISKMNEVPKHHFPKCQSAINVFKNRNNIPIKIRMKYYRKSHGFKKDIS